MTSDHATTAYPAEETVTPIFRHDIPNVDHRELVAVVVSYPPGGGSAIHRHAPSAFVYAHVLSGHVRSQLEGESRRTFGPGEGFYENPGAHHVVSENASNAEPASMLAVFVVDPEDHDLTVADPDQGGRSRSMPGEAAL